MQTTTEKNWANSAEGGIQTRPTPSQAPDGSGEGVETRRGVGIATRNTPSTPSAARRSEDIVRRTSITLAFSMWAPRRRGGITTLFQPIARPPAVSPRAPRRLAADLL